ncbi:MAG: 16S rRNA (guanine(966)-N(2))-methyltransferase RsmD [Alphaproteobacteria bacterium]
MRIIGGTLRGRPIHAPEGRVARPTTDRIREALFNRIDHGRRPCDGARVLDLFAGSGALSLEALSRGAIFAELVDDHAGSRRTIRENVEALGLTARARVFRRDATKLGPRPPAFADPFDLVFCDPPYGTGLGERALEAALAGGWLAPDALVLLERSTREERTVPAGFTLDDTRRHGETTISVLEILPTD